MPLSHIVPTRFSASTSGDYPRRTKGIIKFRLAHAAWGTFVVIDAVFARRTSTSGSFGYYLPSFFGPPIFGFNIQDGAGEGSKHVFNVSADFCAPNAVNATRVAIRVGSVDRIATLPDGAQLYECEIGHDRHLYPYRSGEARPNGDGFDLRVFHHTSPGTLSLIEASGHFIGSPWNLQGTRKLTNVCTPYFTTLPRIASERDLGRIAMASDEKVHLRGMGLFTDPHVEMPVYRGSTLDRKATKAVWIPTAIVAPNHLLRFRPYDSIAYFEAVLPEIVRVGLRPGAVLSFAGDAVTPVASDLQSFDYVICGDAATEDGLVAPFDEENTREIVHLENLQTEDCFDFWLRNPNSDQVSDRRPLFRRFES